MSGGPGAKDAPHTLSEDERAREQALFGLGEEERREVLAWVGENLPYVRRTAVEQRPVYWILGMGLAVGLATYVGGYLIKTSTTTEPLGLVGDLLLGSVGLSGPVSSWSCSSRSSRRRSDVNSSGRSMPMRQPSARRQKLEAAKHRRIDRPKFRPTDRGASCSNASKLRAVGCASVRECTLDRTNQGTPGRRGASTTGSGACHTASMLF